MPRGGERRRGLSLRWQLTLTYAGLLLLSGVVFVIVGLAVIRFVPEGNLIVVDAGDSAPGRRDLTEVFVRYSIVGMTCLACLGVGAGWLLAGRVLRRMSRIMDVVVQVQHGNMQKRVRMPGRADELSTLADTFDAMLTQMQHSMEEHRRFSANASHELRTPHAVMRTILEVARKNPQRDVDVVLERLSITNDRAIALTESLLSLAAAGTGVGRFRTVDLADLAQRSLAASAATGGLPGIVFTSDLRSAVTIGDPVLLEQLVDNLLRNAAVHNHPDGWVSVTTRSANEYVELVVVNSGPIVPPDLVPALTEPFMRVEQRSRTAGASHVGAGVGLAIVASVARAHSGRLTITARPEGGLDIRVRLSSASTTR